MYRTPCPACGAEVRFHAPTSVLAVCPYCHSTLLRDADSVRDIGKMADLLADYSPLQIVSSGMFKGRGFTVLGRIQLRYDAGVWNEWHILFDDGESGWLAESVGQYVLTLRRDTPADAPAFDTLQAGLFWQWQGKVYQFCDVRRAQCVAGEGELPFAVGAGYEAPLADARCGASFLTLDYSADTARPSLYQGEAVTLKQLDMQRLRDERMIEAATGKLPGSAAVLACPSCGAGLDYRAGTATHLNCPSCSSEVDIEGDKAAVIRRHQAGELAPPFTLKNGSIARIDGKEWTLTGTLRWVESEDMSEGWNEYLLYNTGLGFRWLTESTDGWFLGTLMDVWADTPQARQATLGGQNYRRLYPAYSARINYAAGAFPWRARVGDQLQISEYASRDGKQRLACEQSPQEIVWTLNYRVSKQQLAAWFGMDAAALATVQDEQAPKTGMRSLFYLAIAVLLLINLPLLFISDDAVDSLFVTLFALYALYVPTRKDDSA